MTLARRLASRTLPEPRPDSSVSLEKAIRGRRSVRRFAAEPLSLAELSQLLWACQGVTAADGGRTSPSAGALYPLETWAVANYVEDLKPGVYHYEPASRLLTLHAESDLSEALAEAALGQMWMAGAPAVILLSGVVSRTAAKYGPRAERYVHMEVGHAAQNVCLQAEAMGMGTVVVGAFDDRAISRLLGLPSSHAPLALLPVGHK